MGDDKLPFTIMNEILSYMSSISEKIGYLLNSKTVGKETESIL